MITELRKGENMMKNYLNPQVTVLNTSMEDVISCSGKIEAANFTKFESVDFSTLL